MSDQQIQQEGCAWQPDGRASRPAGSWALVGAHAVRPHRELIPAFICVTGSHGLTEVGKLQKGTAAWWTHHTTAVPGKAAAAGRGGPPRRAAFTPAMCDQCFDRHLLFIPSCHRRLQPLFRAQPTVRLYVREPTPRRAIHIGFQRGSARLQQGGKLASCLSQPRSRLSLLQTMLLPSHRDLQVQQYGLCIKATLPEVRCRGVPCCRRCLPPAACRPPVSGPPLSACSGSASHTPQPHSLPCRWRRACASASSSSCGPAGCVPSAPRCAPASDPGGWLLAAHSLRSTHRRIPSTQLLLFAQHPEHPPAPWRQTCAPTCCRGMPTSRRARS